jgi:hypothetical protein
VQLQKELVFAILISSLLSLLRDEIHNGNFSFFTPFIYTHILHQSVARNASYALVRVSAARCAAETR